MDAEQEVARALEPLLHAGHEAELGMALDRMQANALAPSEVRITTVSLILSCAQLVGGGASAAEEAVRRWASPEGPPAAVLALGVRGVARNGFGNSFTLDFGKTCARGGSGGNVKVFSNGSLQCSGLRCLEDAPPLARRVQDALRALMGREDLEVRAPRVSLLNATFSLGQGIDTRALYDVLFPTERERVVMSQQVHRRLMWAVETPAEALEEAPEEAGKKGKGKGKGKAKQVSVLLFHTGKVIVAGAKHPGQIAAAYARVLETVDPLAARLRAALPAAAASKRRRDADEPPRKRGRKRKTETLEAFLQGLQQPAQPPQKPQPPPPQQKNAAEPAPGPPAAAAAAASSAPFFLAPK
jgi:hypothetical protein